MKKIGMVVAIEIESIFRVFGKPENEGVEYGFKVYKYNLDNMQLVVCDTGAGEIAAAAATQYLISHYNVEKIINFGIVGGLTAKVPVFTKCVVENVVHYDYDITEAGDYKQGQYMHKKDIFFEADKDLVNLAISKHPELTKVNCASGDKFVTQKERRLKLGEDFNCDICEMEAAGILITCRRNKVPCLMIKTVSDGINDLADAFFEQADEASDVCFKIIKDLLVYL